MKPLAQTVYVDGRRYVRGATPPVEDAKRITNPMAWEGGEVPDFAGIEDDDTTTPPITTAPPGATPVMGGDAAIPAGDQPDKEGEHVGASSASATSTEIEVPKGNDSADRWRTYAITSGQATAEEVADKSRDELRDTYGPKA